jgi:biotin synthase
MIVEPVQTGWTLDEVRTLYGAPLVELIRTAGDVHRSNHAANDVQICELLSIKTGGCPEDCGYCSQSAHHDTGLRPQPLMDVADVVTAARRARRSGATRFCMGAAWRDVKDNAQFDRVLDMVQQVNDLGMEVCTTLGMVTESQAHKLAAAGLHAYNHNVDTSREYYDKVVTTRTYDERLETIKNVRAAGITVCCGGILGLGESDDDRVSFLHTLANLDPYPESVPINLLNHVPGTPLGEQPDVKVLDAVRVIACARILMPTATVRLSAGRHLMSESDQALCFLAGANSVFSSDRNLLLTTPSPDHSSDRSLFASLGLKPRPGSAATTAGLA